MPFACQHAVVHYLSNYYSLALKKTLKAMTHSILQHGRVLGGSGRSRSMTKPTNTLKVSDVSSPFHFRLTCLRLLPLLSFFKPHCVYIFQNAYAAPPD